MQIGQMEQRQTQSQELRGKLGKLFQPASPTQAEWEEYPQFHQQMMGGPPAQKTLQELLPEAIQMVSQYATPDKMLDQFTEMAKGLQPKEWKPKSYEEWQKSKAYEAGLKTDTTMTETEAAMLPDNDPRKIRWMSTKKELGEGKNQTIQQLTDISLYDPDPKRREEAKKVLDTMEERQVRIAENIQGPIQRSIADRQITGKILTELPKLRAEAITSKNQVDRIDKALALAKTGSVTGAGGLLRSWFAPYGEILGINTKEMNDAQTFKLMTRVITGPMRLQILGPGPVSEWEQKLMMEISGGGGATLPTAIELLNGYRQQAISNIQIYNQTIEGGSAVDPSIRKVYPNVEVPTTPHPSSPAPIPESPAPKPSKTIYKMGSDLFGEGKTYEEVKETLIRLYGESAYKKLIGEK